MTGTDTSSRRVAANGINFAVDEAGAGDTVALLLHGFPQARIAWKGQLPALASLGWRVVAPDLRGYGESDRPRDRSAYDIEHLVDDVAGLFDALGARRKILVGHDWGGVIAWQAALHNRVKLDGLIILNAPHPAIFRAVLEAGWRQRRKSWYVAFFQLPWLPEWQLTRNNGEALARALESQSRNFSADEMAVYRRNICLPGAATAMLNYYRANAVELARAEVPLEKLGVPTLMIWGENDWALDVSLTEGNEAYVQDFSLKRLPGVSHWVLEDAPERVSQAIAEWAREKKL